MTRQQFESELTGEMVAAGIDPAVAAQHVQQFWNGSGYSAPELQAKWLEHRRACADRIKILVTVAPRSRRLAAIAQGAPLKNHERLTGVHMPDSCRGCPHAGAEQCCGGAV